MPPIRRLCSTFTIALMALTGCANVPAPLSGDVSESRKSPSKETPLNALFDGLSSIFGGPATELRERVEAGALRDAMAYYVQHQTELNESRSARPWIDKLAERLNERMAPEYQELTTRLLAAEQPGLPPAKWAEARQVISRSEALLKSRDDDALLSQPSHASPVASALKARLQQTREVLIAAAGAQFAAFAINAKETPQTFFEVYPIEFNATAQQSLALTELDTLAKAMPRLDLDQSMRIMAFFAQLQLKDGGVLAPLLDSWHGAYAKAKSWNDTHSLALEKKLESASHLKSKVPQWNGPLLRVTLIPILGEKLSPSRRSAVEDAAKQAAVGWGASTQPGVTRDAAAKQLGAMKDQSIDLVVLFEGGRVVAFEGPGEPTRHQARYLARHASQPNPALAKLRRELAEAEADWRQAELQEQQAQAQAKQLASQSRSAAGAFGVLALIGTSSFSSALQKSRVTQLTQELGQTPATLSSPVYETYDRLGVKKSLMITAPAALYFYEPKKKRFATLDVSSAISRDYVQFDAPHPNDPNPESLQTQTPQSLIDAEGQTLLRTSLEKFPDLLGSIRGQALNWSADSLQKAVDRQQQAQRETLEKQQLSLVKP